MHAEKANAGFIIKAYVFILQHNNIANIISQSPISRLSHVLKYSCDFLLQIPLFRLDHRIFEQLRIGL